VKNSTGPAGSKHRWLRRRGPREKSSMDEAQLREIRAWLKNALEDLRSAE